MLFVDVESWFAVQIASQSEKRVAIMLGHKGYQIFLPTYTSRRQWSDRVKILEPPLFPGYIFCRICENSAGRLLSTPNVIRVVGFCGRPYPISDAEIGALLQVTRSGVDTFPVPYLQVGEKVHIKEGPLAGITGTITQIKNQQRLVLSVDLIMKSISIDISSVEASLAKPNATASHLASQTSQSFDHQYLPA